MRLTCALCPHKLTAARAPPPLALRQALKTLLEMPFLTKGGPEREEMHTMFELLCKNRNGEPSEGELEPSTTTISKIFSDSQRGGNKKAKRETWQKGLAQLIVKGMTRRAHFKIAICAEVLRNVSRITKHDRDHM